MGGVVFGLASLANIFSRLHKRVRDGKNITVIHTVNKSLRVIEDKKRTFKDGKLLP